jgi:hypothetical protein
MRPQLQTTRVTLNDAHERGRCGGIGGAMVPTSRPTVARPEARLDDDDANANTGTLRGSRDVDPHRHHAAEAIAPRARDAPAVDQQDEPERDVPCHAGVIGRGPGEVATLVSHADKSLVSRIARAAFATTSSALACRPGRQALGRGQERVRGAARDRGFARPSGFTARRQRSVSASASSPWWSSHTKRDADFSGYIDGCMGCTSSRMGIHARS